jgi:hypothetical protein
VERQIKLFRQETKAYHQETGLLIQFILTELFAAQKEASRLAGAAGDAETLETAMAALAGNRKREGRLFNWLSDNGILEKMHHFCCCIVQEEVPEEKTALAMQRTVHQAWIFALQAQVEARILLDSGAKSMESLELTRIVARMNMTLGKAAKHLWRLLERYKQDENVLFFLLRHHHEFDSLYGAGATVQFFRKAFRGGSMEAGHLMRQRYGKRGFSHILPIIDEKISELETAHE